MHKMKRMILYVINQKYVNRLTYQKDGDKVQVSHERRTKTPDVYRGSGVRIRIVKNGKKLFV